ncbi:hypothetical protein [Bacillus cihuensis]|uniref:hypothetical protein n=1 Tax=Bacillus cihuensis TaxID=1208599 RepID=UPI0003F73434|nr:hypothetical protein [Bacillus cihuensis]
MTNREIKVLVKTPYRYWKEDSSFKHQNFVKQDVKPIPLPENINLWVREASAHPSNINLYLIDDMSIEPLYGDLFASGVNDMGEPISLTTDQQQWLANHIGLVDSTYEGTVLGIDIRKSGVLV